MGSSLTEGISPSFPVLLRRILPRYRHSVHKDSCRVRQGSNNRSGMVSSISTVQTDPQAAERGSGAAGSAPRQALCDPGASGSSRSPGVFEAGDNPDRPSAGRAGLESIPKTCLRRCIRAYMHQYYLLLRPVLSQGKRSDLSGVRRGGASHTDLGGLRPSICVG